MEDWTIDDIPSSSLHRKTLSFMRLINRRFLWRYFSTPWSFFEHYSRLFPEYIPSSIISIFDWWGSVLARGLYCSSGMCSMRSPGWQLSTVQILSRTSTGICFAAPVHNAEIVDGRTPVLSASSFWFMSLIANSTFVRNLIITTPSFMKIVSRKTCIRN